MELTKVTFARPTLAFDQMTLLGLLVGLGGIQSFCGLWPLPLHLVTLCTAGFLVLPGNRVNFQFRYFFAALVAVCFLISSGFDRTALIRTLQFFLVVVFSWWMSGRPKKLYEVIINVAFWVCVFFFFAEIAVNPRFQSALTTFDINFFIYSGKDTGVQFMKDGNNFAGAYVGVIAVFLFAFGKNTKAAILVLISLCTGSRGLIVAYAACVVFYVLRSPKILMGLLVLGLLLQPLIILQVDANINRKTRERLVETSQRYVSYVGFSQMGMDHPLGVGMFKGIERSEYFFARWETSAHNTYLSFFGEAGVFGYLSFFACLGIVGWDACRAEPKKRLILVFLLVAYIFLTAYTKSEFWLSLAFFGGAHLETDEEETKEEAVEETTEETT